MEGVDTADSHVNPDHYQRFDKFETIDITEQFNFNRGNVIKYVMRAGHKEGSDELVDLMKARWYLGREIDRINQDRVREVIRAKRSMDTSEYKIP